jgi:hypothetical protein
LLDKLLRLLGPALVEFDAEGFETQFVGQGQESHTFTGTRVEDAAAMGGSQIGHD